jgi:hypothetical protein
VRCSGRRSQKRPHLACLLNASPFPAPLLQEQAACAAAAAARASAAEGAARQQLAVADSHAAWLRRQALAASALGEPGPVRLGESWRAACGVWGSACDCGCVSAVHHADFRRFPSSCAAGCLLGGTDVAWRDAAPGLGCAPPPARARHAALWLPALQPRWPRQALLGCGGSVGGLGALDGGGGAAGAPVPLGAVLLYGGVAGRKWLADLQLVTVAEAVGDEAEPGGEQRPAACCSAGGSGQLVVSWQEVEQLEACSEDPGGPSEEVAGGATSCSGGSLHGGSDSSSANSRRSSSRGACPTSRRSRAASCSSKAHAEPQGPGQRRDFAACAAGPCSFLVHGGFLGNGLGEGDDLYECALEWAPGPVRGSPGAGPAAADAAAEVATSGGGQAGAWRGVWRSVGPPAGASRPAGRSHHTLCACPVRRCAVLFGGWRGGEGCLNDLWVWSWDDGAWWQPDCDGEWKEWVEGGRLHVNAEGVQCGRQAPML